VSDEFRTIYNEHTYKVSKPLPQIPLVEDTINAIIDRARRASEKYASDHGLKVKVSFDGWYNPQRVVLIEYTAVKE